MDSLTIAAFVGYWAFWFLILYGVIVGGLSPKRVGMFVGLWIVGRIGLAYVPWEPAHALFPTYATILAIALVLVIFRGDVRLR